MDSSALSIASGTGPIVKFVLILLIAASVLSWAVIFAKWFSFKKAASQTKAFLEKFWQGNSLDKVFEESKLYQNSPVSEMFRSAYQEFQKINQKAQEQSGEGDAAKKVTAGALENVERVLRKSGQDESLKLEYMLPSLATIASAAPFIGLFGTVWGIMNSFMALGEGGPATLERVAPGISEALIATAVGLAAAIPAVIFYNQYIVKLRRMRSEMDGFATDFTNILKRSYMS